jgi:rfaE bifunctional protein nucleotidyltransferase chain/domain
MAAPSARRDGPARGSPGDPHSKILSREDLLARRSAARAAGRTLVHCHGCFDIVHPGHIRHLRHARAQGDLLLVSITGDLQLKKGTGRPLIPEELRAENLAALDCVDWVYIEDRPTAADLLEEVRPDVYIKGQEYEFNADPRFARERETVERHGGRVVFSSGDVVFSSTALIAALERSEDGIGGGAGVDPYHARLVQLLDDPRLEGTRLMALVSSFRGKRVLVVGEAIIDTYVLCDRPGIAGESPVMTLRPLERRTYDGGAAIIARHLAAMGALPVVVTALPRDDAGEGLRRRLSAAGVEVRAVEARGWRVPEKQRFLVGSQKVMKLDLVEPLSLDARRQDELIALAATTAGEGAGGRIDGAIVADFGLGLFSPAVMERLTRDLRSRVRVLAGDVSGRRSHLRSMRRMDLLTPSESELREAYRAFEEGLPTVVWGLLKDTSTTSAIITMGGDGAIAFDRLPGADAPPAANGAGGDGFRSRLRGEHVPALGGHAVDALGCGDALLATATLALAAGGDLVQAAFLGSIAAAAQARRLGNAVISSSDLRQGIVRLHSSHLTLAPAEPVRTRAVSALGA